jgi:hypothetical protein
MRQIEVQIMDILAGGHMRLPAFAIFELDATGIEVQIPSKHRPQPRSEGDETIAVTVKVETARTLLLVGRKQVDARG